MPARSKTQPITVVGGASPIPSQIPVLPDTVVKRFAEAAKFNEDLEKFWRRFRLAFEDLANAQADKINENYGNTQTLTRNISVVSGDFSAAIEEERIARIDADGALASVISSVEAAYQAADVTIAASVVSEQTARVNADTALAADITTVTASVGGLSATVTTLSSAVASIDGTLAAQWGVALDINGRVVGAIHLNGTAQSSSFVVSVDHFVVENGTGSIQLLDITAAGIVFGADVTSDNFAAGSAGWRIERNSGNAEFNQVTIRDGIIISTVAPPGISPTSSDFTTNVAVTLSAAGGLTIRYTLDGSEVTSGSPVYSSPLNITTTTTLRTKAYNGLGVPSFESQATYTLVPGGGGGGGAVFSLSLSNSGAPPTPNPTGSGLYTAGTVVNIDAAPIIGGSTFLQWSGAPADVALVGSTTSPSTTVTMDKDISLTADY